MDESAVKGVETQQSTTSREECITTISVEGYDTSLHEYYLELLLTKHFSSCGEVLSVVIRREFKKRIPSILKSPLFINFRGEGARDKALELNGSDVGGWNVIVKAVPPQRDFTDSGWGNAKRDEHKIMVDAEVYDTSLPVLDFKIGLCKYFSSCGEVTMVSYIYTKNGKRLVASSSNFRARISIMGKGCVEKAQELSGRTVEGMNVVLAYLMSSRVIKRRTGCDRESFMKAKADNLKKKAKAEKKKKNTTE